MRSTTPPSTSSPHVVAVGLACRFPGGASTPDKLWKLLANGCSAWSEIPRDRMRIDEHYHPNGRRQGTICFKGGHFLTENPFLWDASFFETSDKEAVAIDPQQRMILEVVFEALESAGITRESIDGSNTGVFCGSFVRDYEQICLRDPDDAPQYAATGNGTALLANRVSYAFNLVGPSMTIDTGCSASLVCFHQAFQSLSSGECDLAIVAGPGLILTQATMMPMMGLNFLSVDGKCYAFDERANGYGRGEGIGVVILKRLEDAMHDHNPVRCAVRGTNVNQDGRTLQGITVPSMQAQAANIRRTYKRANLPFDRTAFVECHGTGTQAGDSRELGAIGATIAKGRSEAVVVGSIKTNIGHLEGAAGIAGVAKMILCLERGMIPKHINFNGNPNIDFAELNVHVPRETMEWPVKGLRRGSVNCFGFGGTNAHAILDDAATFLAENTPGYAVHNTTIKDNSIDSSKTSLALHPISSARARGPLLFPYTASDKKGIQRMARVHAEYLASTNVADPDTFLIDYSYTLLERRSVMRWKSHIVARTAAELIQQLEVVAENKAPSEPPIKSTSSGVIETVFAFGGQGAAWHAMGRELLADFDSVRDNVAAASRYLIEDLGACFNLVEELAKDHANTRVTEPAISQPATTVIQVALVDFLASIGVKPVAVIAHSSGEIAAAYAKGAITRKNAWKLAYFRGQAALTLEKMDTVKGTMSAVWLPHSDVQAIINELGCDKTVSVACINSPSHTTIAGDRSAVGEVEDKLRSLGKRFKSLSIPVAYHTQHMQLVRDIYMDQICGVKTLESICDVAMFSSVTGKEVSTQNLNAEYWCSNMVQPVNMPAAVSSLLEFSTLRKTQQVILELSPRAILKLHFETMLESKENAPFYAPLLEDKRDASVSFINAIGRVFCHAGGYPEGYSSTRYLRLVAPEARLHVCIGLPPYPFNHEKAYRWDSHEEQERAAMGLADQRQDIIGRPIPTGSAPQLFRWRHFLRTDENPWILHHMVDGAPIYPAAGMIAMVVQAGRQIAYHPSARRELLASIESVHIVGIEVSNMDIRKPMLVPTDGRGLEVNLSAMQSSDDPTLYHIIITSSVSGIINSRGHLRILMSPNKTEICGDTTKRDILQGMDEAWPSGSYEPLDRGIFYKNLEGVGLQYGPVFRGITSISRNKTRNKGKFKLTIPDTAASMPLGFEFDHLIHPATLDAIFQSISALNKTPLQLVPTHLGRLQLPVEFDHKPGNTLMGDFSAVKHGERKALAKIAVRSMMGGLLTIEDLRIESPVPAIIPDNLSLCSRILWNQDVASIGRRKVNFTDYFALLAHKKPGLLILIVDVPRQVIKAVMDSVTRSDTPLSIRKIVFASSDIEHSCHVQHGACRVDFHPLNDNNSSTRGFESEKYDVVITSDNAFGACALAKTLAHGGPVLRLCSVPESDSALGCALADSETSVVLRNADTNMEFSCLYRKADPTPFSGESVVLLVPDHTSCGHKTLVLEQSLRKSFEQAGVKVTTTYFKDLLTSEKKPKLQQLEPAKHCISLMEIEHTFISTMTASEFDVLKALLEQVPNIMWVTAGVWPVLERKQPTNKAEKAMFWGLARTLVSESWANSHPTLVDLELDSEIEDVTDANMELCAEQLLTIFYRSYLSNSKILTDVQDSEFIVQQESQGFKTYIPRLVPLSELNSKIVPQPTSGNDVEETDSTRSDYDPPVAAISYKCDNLVTSMNKQPGQTSRPQHRPEQDSPRSAAAASPLWDHTPRTPGTPQTETPALSHDAASEGTMHLDENGVYVVAGGLGGLGREIVELLIKMGASKIGIMSRPGGTSSGSDAQAWSAGLSAKVGLYAADVCDAAAVASALNDMERDFAAPIKGAIMAAAVVLDSAFDRLTFDIWRRVIEVKARGSINLYEALSQRNFDFLIMLSSAAGVIGNRTQANYNAANLVQDSLAQHGAAAGKNVVALDLGPVLEAGMLARDEELAKKLLATGFIGVGLQDLRLVLQTAMNRSSSAELLHANTVVGVGSGGLLQKHNPKNPFWEDTALYSYLRRVDLPDAAADNTNKTNVMAEKRKEELIDGLTQAGTSMEQRTKLVAGALAEAVVQEIGNRKVEEVDLLTESPANMGVDSLTAIGVRNWVMRTLDVELSIMQITSGMTFMQLGESVVEKMKQDAVVTAEGSESKEATLKEATDQPTS